MKVQEGIEQDDHFGRGMLYSPVCAVFTLFHSLNSPDKYDSKTSMTLPCI